MVEAIVHGSETPFPASIILKGEYGVTDVSSSSPCILGPSGLVRVVEQPLTEAESAQFAAVAVKISELADSIAA
jgi:malate/lactate dehydrogenase